LRYRRFEIRKKLFDFNGLQQVNRISGCPSSASLALGTFPPGGRLQKRLTIFAEKMKFTEFFSGKGKALNKALK